MTVKVATKKEMTAVARDLVRPELESVENDLRNVNRRLDAVLREVEKIKNMIETEAISRRGLGNRLNARLATVMKQIAVLENSRGK